MSTLGDRSSAGATITDDNRLEGIVVVAVVVVAVLLGLRLGMSATGERLGLWGAGSGSAKIVEAAEPVLSVVAAQAKAVGGAPPRILLDGSVGSASMASTTAEDLRRRFPTSEIKNNLRVRVDPQGRESVLLRVASGALIQQWDVPRFGDLKRLDIIWQRAADGSARFLVRGACYSATCGDALDAAFNAIPEDSRSALQLITVDRPLSPAPELQNTLSSALKGRTARFDDGAEVALDLSDLDTAGLVADVAPLMADLRGIEVLVNVGADDRERALLQAQALKSALVAAGADANGLRPVPAKANNPLSLFVLEKE